MSRQVLITGAGGFVMSNIIPGLVNAGYRVIALDRRFDPDVRARWAEMDPITLIEAEADFLPDLEADFLILGAALTASPEEMGLSPAAHYRANLLPALNALDWAEAHGVRRVIGVSSGAVYAETEGAVSEDLPPTPRGLYAASKAAIEALFTALRHDYGRDVAVIRLSNIYGLNEISRPTRLRVSMVGRLIEEAVTTGQMTPPDEPARDWTFAPDVGRALIALLEANTLLHALYNVAAGQRMSPLDIASVIQSRLPEVQIARAENGASSPVTRRGWLASDRLARDTGFRDWTPFAEGIAQALDARLRAAQPIHEVQP